MENESTYSLRELITAVNREYEGLFETPNSSLSIGDERFFNLLDIEHQENEQVLVLSALEQEQDYLVIGPNEVRWTDNWSGEDERIYKGNVQDNLEFSFDEDVFVVNGKNLQFSKQSGQLKAPIVQIDMKMNNPTDRSNTHELGR